MSGFELVQRLFSLIGQRFDLVTGLFNRVNLPLDLITGPFNLITARFDRLNQPSNLINQQFKLIPLPYGLIKYQFDLVQLPFCLVLPLHNLAFPPEGRVSVPAVQIEGPSESDGSTGGAWVGKIKVIDTPDGVGSSLILRASS
jgi:hypothetical protein